MGQGVHGGRCEQGEVCTGEGVCWGDVCRARCEQGVCGPSLQLVLPPRTPTCEGGCSVHSSLGTHRACLSLKMFYCCERGRARVRAPRTEDAPQTGGGLRQGSRKDAEGPGQGMLPRGSSFLLS